MVSDLIKYIEDAKKRGFALEQIKDHLSSHGWNDYLIEYAMRHVERRSDRRWLQGSLMAVFAVMLFTTGTVWLIDHDVSSGSMSISCVFESSDGAIESFTDPAQCCQKAGRSFCALIDDGPRIVDSAGQTLFVGQVSCRLGDGTLIGEERALRSCSQKH